MTSVSPPDDSKEEWQASIAAVDALLAPKAVAIVGASQTENKPGHILLKNIVDSDYEGEVYPINPKADEILGLPVYKEIGDVPRKLDVVLFAVPGELILDMIPACAEKGTKSIVIVSAGFQESVDEDRQDLGRQLRETCSDYGIRAIGPNTTGMISMKNQFIASFIPFPTWQDGNIALAAQTGIFAGVYMEELMVKQKQTLGYNYSLGLGNKIDIDETDFIRYAGQDEDIDVIQLHAESIKEPTEFFPDAARVAQSKPIILLKTGRTKEGREMAQYHTASHPTVDEEIDNACRSSGIIRASTIPEFMDYAKGFSYQPPPRGRSVAVLSFSGANAVMAADYVAQSSLELASLSMDTLERVKELVPDWQPIRNPVDQWLALPSGPRNAHEAPLKAILEDPSVDAVVTIHLATTATDFEGIDEMYNEANRAHPDIPIVSYIMGAEIKDRWIDSLEETNIPVFDSGYAAVDTLEKMYWWNRYSEGVENYDTEVQSDIRTI